MTSGTKLIFISGKRYKWLNLLQSDPFRQTLVDSRHGRVKRRVGAVNGNRRFDQLQ